MSIRVDGGGVPTESAVEVSGAREENGAAEHLGAGSVGAAPAELERDLVGMRSGDEDVGPYLHDPRSPVPFVRR